MKIKEKIALVILTLALLGQLALGSRDETPGDPKTGKAGRSRSASVEPVRTGNAKAAPVPISPETLAYYFRTELPEAPVSIVTPKPVEPTQSPQRFIKLGVINDSKGIKRLYVKHLETGRVIKARLDGVAETGVRYFQDAERIEYIEIDGEKYQLQKDSL